MESLEEKFKKVVITYDYSDKICAEQCVEIAEEFAVGFNEWVDNNLSIVYDLALNNKPCDNKTLLELYKQHLKTKDNGKV